MNDQAQQQQPPQQPPQQTEAQRVLERKKFVIKTLQDKFTSELWRERLLKIAGGDESKILKGLQSFTTYILNDRGGKDDESKNKPKVFIADCAISTISSCFLEAFQMGIEVGGGRDHAYLVNYAGNCELEISYKGFIYALGQHFDNPYVVAENVFKGDKLAVSMKGENAYFEYTPNPDDPFPGKWDNLVGCFCYFSYTQRNSGEKVSRITRIQKDGPDGLDMIRSKARGSFAWKDFPFEQTKKSTLRRAAKIPFAMIDFADDEVNPEEQDNKHYVLEKGSSDRLQALLEAYKEDEDENAKKKAIPVGNTDKPDAGKVTESQPSGATTAEQNAPAGENPPAADATGDPAVDSQAGIIDASYEDVTAQSSGNGAASAETVTAATEAAWNGKTIYTGSGKSIDKETFTTSAQAGVYLKKILTQRTKKETRREIWQANHLLMIALQKDGHEKLITELTSLIEKGE